MQTLLTIAGINRGNIIHHHHLPFNHIVKLSESTLPLLKSSSHYPGETAIRIDSYPAGGVFLTQTLLPPSGSQTSHLWHNSGEIKEKSWVRAAWHSQRTTLPRVIGPLTRLWAYANGSPHILTTSRMPQPPWFPA